jgi:hypothetical protein
MLKKMSMAGTLGVLSVFSTVTTTEVEDVDGGAPGSVVDSPVAATTEDVEDIDGGTPGGCCLYSRQWPPPM